MSYATKQALEPLDAGRERNRYLPQPPDDTERDLYLGPQHRWVASVSFFGYILIVISVTFFVMRRLWAAWLFLPLLISTVGTTVSLFTSSRRRRISLEGHRALVESWTPDYIPSVDVFLPSAGEDLQVLRNTYHYVSRLGWPGDLTVYVLDDSARDVVRELAEQHGFVYLSRPNRGQLKKAGNLRYGFEYSDGDLIAIFDADFVPRPDFLFELTPYMDDPTVAIVQSPQYFDIDKQMNWLQRAAGGTQVLFYRWVQPSRDRSNAAICVGTCALYRRAALNKSGGFAQIGHSEDVHTGVNLMKVGYRIQYVPTLVSKGICPDTFSQFVTQQYRWCSGSMSLLFSRGFHGIDLTLMQRLSYWSGFLYYITTAINVFAIPLPVILMGYFAASRVRASNYIFVMLALVVRQALIPLITCERESLFGLARIQTTYSFSHAVALYDVLRKRTDSWVATGAAQRSATARRVRRLARVWLVVVQLLLWGAIAWRAPRYGMSRYGLMTVFALLSLYVVYPIVLGRSELPRLPRPRRVGLFARRKRGRHEARGGHVAASTFPAARPQPAPARASASRLSALVTSAWPWVGLICAGQVRLAGRSGLNVTAFEDEGLYVFMGHRIIQHLLHGAFLQEYPGAYFSGAPGLYPVMAAIGDHLGGLQGARTVSLAFAIVATVGVYGLGYQLFGKVPGLVGALAFMLCGSVIYQSHLATFDSTVLGLVAVAAWLAVYSTKRDGLLWAPLVSALLTLAFLAKYAGAAYAPVVAALAVAVGWRRLRWTIVRRAAYVLLGALVMGFFVIELWGQDLIRGIITTTSSRIVQSHATKADLISQVIIWVGPWLCLAVLGGLVRLRRQPMVVAVLLAGSIIGPAQQIRIGESTSLTKHVGFGIIFGAPLIGDLLARTLHHARPLTVPLVACVIGVLGVLGVHFSGQFLTSWTQDNNLRPALLTAISASPHKAILGERPAPQRYELRKLVAPAQWNDTYSFYYAGLRGEQAYKKAIDQSHFGVVYLSMTTTYGRYVHRYLATHDTPYHLTAKVPRYLRGKPVGEWLIYTPKLAGAKPQGRLSPPSQPSTLRSSAPRVRVSAGTPASPR
jgi:cellulose synthase/poly-beta-1,6-N-acetylglucosamine synthase-like glycosyltransferase